jgi:hypothetical protein
MAFSDLFWTAPDGLVLHARDYPAQGAVTGVPVIALHGLTRNARDFEDLAPRSPPRAGGCWRSTCAAAAARPAIRSR